MTDWALPIINLNKCDRCGRCVSECPTGAVEMGADGPVIVRPGDCDYCSECEVLCPQEAIQCPYEIVWGP